MTTRSTAFEGSLDIWGKFTNLSFLDSVVCRRETSLKDLLSGPSYHRNGSLRLGQGEVTDIWWKGANLNKRERTERLCFCIWIIQVILTFCSTREGAELPPARAVQSEWKALLIKWEIVDMYQLWRSRRFDTAAFLALVSKARELTPLYLNFQKCSKK